ncbi:MAG: hypothetical protein JNM17_30310 [Archangium sp.]|nr:hypothetical protein [Archangium sp.]
MARAKLTRAEAENALRDQGRRVDALGQLPDEVDAELAADVALTLIKPTAPSSWLFAHHSY